MPWLRRGPAAPVPDARTAGRASPPPNIDVCGGWCRHRPRAPRVLVRHTLCCHGPGRRLGWPGARTARCGVAAERRAARRSLREPVATPPTVWRAARSCHRWGSGGARRAGLAAAEAWSRLPNHCGHYWQGQPVAPRLANVLLHPNTMTKHVQPIGPSDPGSAPNAGAGD